MNLIYSRLKVMLVLAASGVVAGCGFKGPLYLPDAKAGARQPGPVSTPDPAPERPVPAEAAPPIR